jgi:hypothetical protein
VSASGRLLLFTFWKFMVDEWLLSIAKQNYLTSSCAWLLTAYSVEKLFFVDFWTLDVPAETRLNKNNGLPWVNLSKLIEFTI